jgi:hypothetical protein
VRCSERQGNSCLEAENLLGRGNFVQEGEIGMKGCQWREVCKIWSSQGGLFIIVGGEGAGMVGELKIEKQVGHLKFERKGMENAFSPVVNAEC